jgi:hypothetical protein
MRESPHTTVYVQVPPADGQLYQVSTLWQLPAQPSPPWVSPSSHTSFAVATPSPQRSQD